MQRDEAALERLNKIKVKYGDVSALSKLEKGKANKDYQE